MVSHLNPEGVPVLDEPDMAFKSGRKRRNEIVFARFKPEKKVRSQINFSIEKPPLKPVTVVRAVRWSGSSAQKGNVCLGSNPREERLSSKNFHHQTHSLSW